MKLPEIDGIIYANDNIQETISLVIATKRPATNKDETRSRPVKDDDLTQRNIPTFDWHITDSTVHS